MATTTGILCFLLGLASGMQPVEVEYAELGQTSDVVKGALGADGIVAITNIPKFSDLRQRVLLGMHACVSDSPKAQTLELADGTTRRTLAASSGMAGIEPVEHGSPKCEAWEKQAAEFRRVVAECVESFGHHLDSLLGVHGEVELLGTRGGRSYRTVSEIVSAGERLEHFHSYELPHTQGDGQTIDFHVDQGVFIAFTPALLLDSAEIGESAAGGTFALRRADGTEVEVSFNPDSLVFLFGDSLNAFLNDKHVGRPVHVPMHAFKANVGSGVHRVWYGMMQLPPVDALHEDSGMTYGELRQQIIQATTSGEESHQHLASEIGCSSKAQRARELSDTCGSSQIYCWHRCFDFTEEISPEACSLQGMGFNCTSQWDEIWLPDMGHGDFNPACTNSTTLVTPLPTVPQPTEGSCQDFEMLSEDALYANRAVVVANETYVLWNVVGNDVEVKMVHNGRVGWMALGIESIGGARNGMNGAEIVMGQYNPENSEPFTVNEYKVHDDLSAYRHWKRPYSQPAISDTLMSVTDCFSVMAFKTHAIYGQALNISSGTNRMVWALTHSAYVTEDANGFAAYHSAVDGSFMERHRFRGHLELSFTASTTTTTSEVETGDALRVPAITAAIAFLLAAVFSF